MLEHPENIIGDAWFYSEEDIAHAFYLTCSKEMPAHKAWDIGHAISRDLLRWEVQELALRRGIPGSWDECLATGSVVKYRDGYAMAYTSSTTAETGLAFSNDLYTWERFTKNPTTSCDDRYYERMSNGTRKALHWRDPFLFHEGRTWHQIVCASSRSGPENGRGTLGWAISEDLKEWMILPPPAVEFFSQELECPQIYYRKGMFYLLFSAFPELLLPEKRADIERSQHWGSSVSSLPWNVDKKRNCGPSVFVMMSSSLRGPFRAAPQPCLFQPTDKIQPYASQILHFKGGDYCLGTIWGVDCVSYISDPIPVAFTSEGISIANTLLK